MVAFSGTVSLALIVNVPAFSILEIISKNPIAITVELDVAG